MEVMVKFQAHAIMVKFQAAEVRFQGPARRAQGGAGRARAGHVPLLIRSGRASAAWWVWFGGGRREVLAPARPAKRLLFFLLRS